MGTPFGTEMRKRIAVLLVACIFGLMLSACETADINRGDTQAGSGEQQFETLRLFTAEGAAVRMAAADNTEDGVDVSGVLFETSAQTYGGTLSGKFAGNFELLFGFRKGEAVADRRLTITFASLSDAQQVFSVIYESGWNDPENGRGRSGVYVKYEDEVRTSRYWQSDKNLTDPDAWQNNDNFDVDEALASPMFGGEGEFEEEFGNLYGTLSLEWTTEGVLEVYASERMHDTDPRCIAAFDGTAGGIGFDPSLGTWGLPRIDFSQGYTISFVMEVLSGEEEAADMYFCEIVTGIRGSEKAYSLAEKSMAAAPDFYVKANG